MRKIVITINVSIAIFFAGFLGYTLVARRHLNAQARRFVTEKTVQHAGPMVELAEKSLNTPFAQKLIPADHAAAVRDEIREYHENPEAYVADLTREKIKDVGQVKSDLLREKVAAIKERIRSFYDATLDALVFDLRIFATSNLLATMIASGLGIYFHRDVRKSLIVFSFLMLVAVAYCSFMYVNDLTFFRILFRTHLGGWYPILLAVCVFGLWKDYGRGWDDASSAAVKENNSVGS